MSPSTSGKILFRGSTDNGIVTILTPEAHAAFVEMNRRHEEGESWDQIHGSTPYPVEGIFCFVPPQDLAFEPLWTHASGSHIDLDHHFHHFISGGGQVLDAEVATYVPLSGDIPPDYVYNPESIAEAFGLDEPPRERVLATTAW